MKSFGKIFEMAKEVIAGRPDLYASPSANGADMQTAENLQELADDYTETEGGDLEDNLQQVHEAYRAVYGYSITDLMASGDYAGAIEHVQYMRRNANTTKTKTRAAILLKAAESGVWLIETLQTPEQQNACRVMIESLIQEARRILIAS